MGKLTFFFCGTPNCATQGCYQRVKETGMIDFCAILFIQKENMERRTHGKK